MKNVQRRDTSSIRRQIEEEDRENTFSLYGVNTKTKLCGE